MDTTTPFLIFMTYYIKTSLNVIKYATFTATKYGRAIKLAKHKGKGVLSILCSLSQQQYTQNWHGLQNQKKFVFRLEF